ncbi:MAG: hypothetical protein IK004_09510 [Bacteroidales bacterium]|nr:hypothetical protein [Bacteroidales bacterium]
MNVKVILPTNQPGDSYIKDDKMFLKDISTISEADGDAVFQSSTYSEIFGFTRKRSKIGKKRLSIVKISANGESIHRAFKSEAVNGIKKDMVGLSPSSIRLLSDRDGKNPTVVEVEIGGMFPFYWEHPDKAIRISFKLGLLSLLLGVLSFAISIITWM